MEPFQPTISSSRRSFHFYFRHFISLFSLLPLHQWPSFFSARLSFPSSPHLILLFIYLFLCHFARYILSLRAFARALATTSYNDLVYLLCCRIQIVCYAFFWISQERIVCKGIRTGTGVSVSFKILCFRIDEIIFTLCHSSTINCAAAAETNILDTKNKECS